MRDLSRFSRNKEVKEVVPIIILEKTVSPSIEYKKMVEETKTSDLEKALLSTEIISEDEDGQEIKKTPEAYKSNNNKAGDEEYARLKALSYKVSDIKLKLVLELLNSEPNQDKIKNKWKVRSSDGNVVGNVTANGQKWYNHNLFKGGIGAVSFIEHVEKLNWKNSVLWLAKQYGEDVDDAEIKAMEKEKTYDKVPFSPPAKIVKYIDYIKNYLVNERCLDKELVERLIKEDKIYSDEHKNVVFLSKTSAELRGTRTDVKELHPGSSRIHAFSVIPLGVKPTSVSITEAAIDTISYAMLHKDVFAMSAAGCNSDFAIRVGNDCLKAKMPFKVAFDNDLAGHKGSQMVFNYFYCQAMMEKKYQISSEEFYTLYKEKILFFPPMDGQLFFSLEGEKPIIEMTLTIPKRITEESKKILEKVKDASYKVGDNQIAANPKGIQVVESYIIREKPISKDWNQDIVDIKESLLVAKKDIKIQESTSLKM